jgi:metallophosphoesterase (TIGR03768 family)
MKRVATRASLLFLFFAALSSPAHAAPPRSDTPEAGPATRPGAVPAPQPYVASRRWPGPAAPPTYPIDPEVYTTRERTVHPASITDTPPYLTIDRAGLYGPRGYSAWTFGDGVDAGILLLAPNSPAGTFSPTARLLNFFTMSDIHIVDKESPVQAIYGALLPGQNPPIGFGNANTSAYSPIMLSTTQVLDAAVQTINALHRSRTPFDFGMSLGDAANNNQYNELRWYIDVLDGKTITPSSGAHRGAGTVDYQKPYQAAGLDRSIPWYQTIGNHDQYWCGTLLYDDYARGVLVGDTVLDMGLVGSPAFPTFDARGYYMGVLDGDTEYGDIVGAGDATTMAPPVIAPDPDRRALSTAASTSLNWMKEFFDTSSSPKGHGFTRKNLENDFASYTFEPRADVPLKVIVLDDTCKENPYAAASSYARACLDQTRYDWLVAELEQGQAEGKLMIITAHIPVGPRWNVPEALPIPPKNIPNDAVISLFLPCGPDPAVPCYPYSVVTDASLLETLHNYSNLVLWISGHRHINTVTPQPAPASKGPEFGFWEVETSSLRDFPQEFRTFEIVRNDNNTLSIFVTDVDPSVQHDSPAAKSRGYAIGANRVAEGVPGLGDTTSRAYNAELIKPLPAPDTLTVTVTGPGTVASSPYSGVQCPSGSSCSAAYLPGAAVTLVATAAPGAAFAGWTPCAGQSTCTITMNGNETVTAKFTSAPTLTVSPGYKDFGNVAIGQSATALFTVRNTAAKGVASLAIGTISITGSTPSSFGLVAGRDDCSGRTVLSGDTCSFQVSFAPASALTKLATVTIPSTDPGGPEVVQLTGVGR